MLCKGVAEWFMEQGNEIEIITSPDENRQDLGYEVNEIFLSRINRSNILLEKNYDAVFVFADLFSPSMMLNPGECRKSILILNLDENVYRWIQEDKIPNLQEKIDRIKSFTHVVSFCQDAPVNKFLDENKIKYHFIPNFSRDVLCGPKSNKITKETFGIKKKIIFNHGLIEERKNQLNLMHAFLDSKLDNDFHLIILGSPRGVGDREYFLRCKEIGDSSDSITMIKGTNSEVIINSLLSLSDIYVLPSTAEGLPLVLLESMSAGLPWVSTPVGGVPAVFGDLQGGKVMSTFDLSELKESVHEVEGKNSRVDWESKFNVDRAGRQYNDLLKMEKDYSEEIEFLKKHKISFATQAYNEEDVLSLHLDSCLQFSDIIDEFHIINHRSSDDTQKIIESYEEEFEKRGIYFHWKYEQRDFSRNFSHGDLRTDTVRSCRNEIVFNHDADFVFGKGFIRTMYLCVKALEKENTYACGYEVPVVSKSIFCDNNRITRADTCRVHVNIPRVVKKSSSVCLQNHIKGKCEWWHPINQNGLWEQIKFIRESVLSINIKSDERQEIRRTMNVYFQKIAQGEIDQDWLQCDNLEKEKVFADRNEGKKINIIKEKYYGLNKINESK